MNMLIFILHPENYYARYYTCGIRVLVVPSRKAAARNDILQVVTLVCSTRVIFDVCHYVILDIKEMSLTRDHHFDKLRKCVD